MVQRQQGVRVSLSSAARDALTPRPRLPLCSSSVAGHRLVPGTAFVNPLARELFMIGSGHGEELTVTEVCSENGQWALSLQSGLAGV